MADDRYGIGTTPNVLDENGKVLIAGGTPRIIDRYPERLIRDEENTDPDEMPKGPLPDYRGGGIMGKRRGDRAR